jgi:hypothetical protein
MLFREEREMLKRMRMLSATLAVVFLAGSAVGCKGEEPKTTERWAATQNTNVDIDWDKVNEAYKAAEGPADLEKRINEIYKGDEVISVAVQDVDDKVQEVTGFFDKNQSGSVDEGEKIFTIKREITGEGTAQVQTVGHGPYYGYTSPMLSIMSGMMLGSMMSMMFMPSYSPMYRTPYTTSAGRTSELRNTRPARSTVQSRPKASGSGRTYDSRQRSSGGFGSGSKSFGGGRRGGGGFGVSRAGRARPARLTA